MSDDPDRKKSMREQVEEYKKRQKLDEEAARKAAEGSTNDEDDLDEDDEDEGDDGLDWEFVDPEVAAAEARASGAGVVRIVSAIFLFVGVVLLLVSAATFWFTRQSVSAEVSVSGVVVKNVVRSHTTRSRDSSRETTSDYYHAVVEFPLADGSKKTVEMSEANWPKAYDEGTEVAVRYDPKNPLRARLGGGTAMDFFATLLTGFLGLVFSSIAIAVRRALG